MWKFAFSPLDRVSYNRDDSDFILQQHQNPNAWVLVFNERYQLLMQADGVHPVNGRSRFNDADKEDWSFLGIADNVPWFCQKVYGEDFERLTHQTWNDLRLSLPLIAEPFASISAYAKALLYWQRNHQYCGKCGEPTDIIKSGHEQFCYQCEKSIFPRTDPAIITAVTFKDEILLARQASWPDGRYSVLAGFVEPGESFEQAVEREVKEETNIDVEDVEYFASQPWPFPCSIMIGFTANAKHQDIQFLDDEIDEAIWVSPSNLIPMLESKKLIMSSRESISFALVNHWAKSHGLNLSKYSV